LRHHIHSERCPVCLLAATLNSIKDIKRITGT
jgi:hypothetical protein